MALVVSGSFTDNCVANAGGGTTPWSYTGTVTYENDLGSPASLSVKLWFEYLTSAFGVPSLTAATISATGSGATTAPTAAPTALTTTALTNMGYSSAFTMYQGSVISFTVGGNLAAGAGSSYDFIASAARADMSLTGGSTVTPPSFGATPTPLTSSWIATSSYLAGPKVDSATSNNINGSVGSRTSGGGVSKLWGVSALLGTSSGMLHCAVVQATWNVSAPDNIISSSPNFFVSAVQGSTTQTAVITKRCSSLSQFADGLVDESEPGTIMFDLASIRRVDPVASYGMFYVAGFKDTVGTDARVNVVLGPDNFYSVNSVNVAFNLWTSSSGLYYKSFPSWDSISVGLAALPSPRVKLSAATIIGNGGSSVTAGYGWSWTGTVGPDGTAGLYAPWIRFFIDPLLRPTSVVVTYPGSDGTTKSVSLPSKTDTISLANCLTGGSLSISMYGIAGNPNSSGTTANIEVYVGGSTNGTTTRAATYRDVKSIVVNKAPTPPTAALTVLPPSMGTWLAPVINARADPSGSVAGLDSSGAVDPISKWVYDFGDGTTLTNTSSAVALHNYYKAGTYTTSLTLVSVGLFRSTVSTQITVTKNLPTVVPVSPNEGSAPNAIPYTPVDPEYPAFQVRRKPRR